MSVNRTGRGVRWHRTKHQRNTDLVPWRIRWLGKGEEGGREGNGVSFRGIDVSQYRPDAVDTPICNPRGRNLCRRGAA